MKNINTKTVLDKLSNRFEKEIETHRIFYSRYLLGHSGIRLELLSKLNTLITAYQKFQGSAGMMLGNTSYFEAERKNEEFIEKYWGDELLQKYNQEVTYASTRKDNDYLREDGFWLTMLRGLSATFEEHREKTKAEIGYRLNFMVFLRDCISNQGLHPFIHKRDIRIYKRYNLIVTFKENRQEYSISRTLLSRAELESEYLAPFYREKPLYVHGKIIKSSSISRLKITTTLLSSDEEIGLFGHIKGFSWNRVQKDEDSLASHCIDETNLYLKNPHADDPKKLFKNNSITYIAQSRIDELSSLKNKQFDTSKLVSLCNELNQCSTIGSVVAVASLQRTIINHVPPVFGFRDFGQVVAQFETAKSVKKNFERLLNSMKSISDNHLHSPITSADSLPNMTQVDFSNDLDVLLAEICKLLKSWKTKAEKSA